MDTPTVAATTVIEAPPVVETPAQTPEQIKADIEKRDGQSLSDHEKAFSNPPRHRAESQKATAEDVPRINELTKRLRAVEQENAELKKTATPAAAKPAAPIQTPRIAAPPQAPAAFADPKPTIEQFSAEADPYAEWLLAVGRWDRKKEAHEQAVESHKQTLEGAQKRQADAIDAARQTHLGRVRAFKNDHADFDDLTAKYPYANIPTPIAFEAALATADDGAALMYALMQHPEVFEELYALTDDKPVTAPLVALVQRRLRSLAPAASTGSAAPRVVIPPAPRSPNPVRTVPQAPISDGRPKDDDSLSAHEKFHYPKGPRGGFRR